MADEQHQERKKTHYMPPHTIDIPISSGDAEQVEVTIDLVGSDERKKGPHRIGIPIPREGAEQVKVTIDLVGSDERKKGPH